jgi:hypothetical protein
MSEIEEVVGTLDRLNSELQDLLVRGLRICGSEHLRPLRGIHTEPGWATHQTDLCHRIG